MKISAASLHDGPRPKFQINTCCTLRKWPLHRNIETHNRISYLISNAFCRAGLIRLPGGAALCYKSKRRRRVGWEPILRRLSAVHGHWCCWMDADHGVNKNGENSGSAPRHLCLTSEHLMPPSGFCESLGPPFPPSFSSECCLTVRLMIFIWHASHSIRRAASSNKRSGKKQVIMTLVSSSKRKPSDCFYAAAFCLHFLFWNPCAVSGEKYLFNVEVRWMASPACLL